MAAALALAACASKPQEPQVERQVKIDASKPDASYAAAPARASKAVSALVPEAVSEPRDQISIALGHQLSE
jgi:hypothetical protein